MKECCYIERRVIFNLNFKKRYCAPNNNKPVTKFKAGSNNPLNP